MNSNDPGVLKLLKWLQREMIVDKVYRPSHLQIPIFNTIFKLYSLPTERDSNSKYYYEITANFDIIIKKITTKSLKKITTKSKIIMENKDFRNLVSSMRNLQKEYFRTRDRSILTNCRKKEKLVDEEINGIQNIFSVQINEQKKTFVKSYIVRFLEWQNKVNEETPLTLNTDLDDIAEMFLMESFE